MKPATEHGADDGDPLAGMDAEEALEAVVGDVLDLSHTKLGVRLSSCSAF